MNRINLEHADLCINCEAIFDGRISGVCPACGSAQTHALAKWVYPIGRVLDEADKIVLAEQHRQRWRLMVNGIGRTRRFWAGLEPATTGGKTNAGA